jgi:adenosine kinase
MIEHARDCATANIPFIFDPGQGLPMFNGEELTHFIELATYVAVNDYEAELLTERTGLSLQQIAERVSALIVTRGEQGAEIFTSDGRLDVPVVKVADIVDPTGCGDAFRAGMLFGLTRGMDWMTIGRLSSLMGAIKIASQAKRVIALKVPFSVPRSIKRQAMKRVTTTLPPQGLGAMAEE